MEKSIDNVKQKDIELYNAWKANPSKQNMSKLLASLKGIMAKEVNRVAGSLPKASLEAEVMKGAINAIRNFNPNGGAQLSTFVSSYIQKVRRLNYENQNMSRLPESKQLEYGSFKKTVDYLKESLNRDPTDHEIAAEMSWKSVDVSKFKGMLFEDHYESGTDTPVEAHRYDFEKTKFDYIMEQLDEQEKIIMESLMEPDDKKRLSAQQLAEKLNVNQNRLSYLKTKLKKKILSIQQGLGEFE